MLLFCGSDGKFLSSSSIYCHIVAHSLRRNFLKLHGNVLNLFVCACVLDTYRVTVKQDVTQDGIAAEAQIVNVDSTDSGPYFCQASNLYGRDQQLVQLQVLEPPEAPKTLTAALITSRSVNLKWQPRGSDANEVTKYIVEYMEHDGTWQEIIIADPPQYTALIENLKPATRYTFRVIAEGQAGQSAPSQELQVKTEPQRPGKFSCVKNAPVYCHSTRPTYFSRFFFVGGSLSFCGK